MTVLDALEAALNRFVSDVTAVLPDFLNGLVFLVVAGIAVKLVTAVLKRVLGRVTAPGDRVYRQFALTVVSGFLWFAVILSFLSIIGLTLVAASLGTATGFLALGVAYALSSMIEDAVAGIYLLRDPDFNPGDIVTAGDVTGEVEAIELRKTRISVDGDTVVRGNGAIEKGWKKHGPE